MIRLMLILCLSAASAVAGVCKGADPCKACRDCSACWYCGPKNPKGGSCGTLRNQNADERAKSEKKRAR